MLQFDMVEVHKLGQLPMQCSWSIDCSVDIKFQTAMLSEFLQNFLERNGFTLRIAPESGMIEGIWTTGPHPEEEYRALRKLFGEYLVELPAYEDIPKK